MCRPYPTQPALHTDHILYPLNLTNCNSVVSRAVASLGEPLAWLGSASPFVVSAYHCPISPSMGVGTSPSHIVGERLTRRVNESGLACQQPRWPVTSGVSGSSSPLTLPRTSDTWRPCPFSRQWTWPGAGRRGSRSPLPQRERVGGNRRAVSS